MPKVLTKRATRGFLADAVFHATAGYAPTLDDSWVGLYTAIGGGGPSPDSVAADVTEAAGAWYSRHEVVGSGLLPTNDFRRPLVGAGGWHFVQYWQFDGIAPTEVLGAAWYDAASAGHLLALDPFPAPVPLLTDQDWVSVIVWPIFAFDQDYGPLFVVP